MKTNKWKMVIQILVSILTAMENGDPDTGKYPHRNCNNTRYDIMHGTRTDHILKETESYEP